VAKVLKALAHAGIVSGARGAAGGYRIAFVIGTWTGVRVAPSFSRSRRRAPTGGA